MRKIQCRRPCMLQGLAPVTTTVILIQKQKNLIRPLIKLNLIQSFKKTLSTLKNLIQKQPFLFKTFYNIFDNSHYKPKFGSGYNSRGN